MGWIGDADALDAYARRLAADADAVAARTQVLQRSGSALSWLGPAAEAFRRALSDDVVRVQRAAAELDQAAAAVRAYAACVRERQEQLRALERVLERALRP